MKLSKIQVRNFRSVEDSGEFEVGKHSLCLVGKNEAGKSAILQALTGLNPHPSTPFTYNVERDYPRRYFTEYKNRHGGKQAEVIRTEWSLSAAEVLALEKIIGPGAISSGPVVITRSYGDTEPSIELTINLEPALTNLMNSAGLSAGEREPLASAKTTDEMRAALEEITSRTPNQTKLLEKINGLPGKNLKGALGVELKKLLPKFMYFSYYDRMVGQIRLDTFEARKSGGATPSIETGEQVFIDFIEYAGTSVAQIQTSTTYESLNAKCEAASATITDQLREYWTQNPFLEIEVRVTKAETQDAPPFNEGVIARARVKNNLHRLSLPFSERSAGFIWFFSFLVKFSQVQKASEGGLLLLLDEPGLSLHPKAQADLLRYFAEKLEPKHQVIFSTHSPFMVPADNLPSIRIVEDKVTSPRPGVWSSDGTKVRSDVLALDRDTLFPLQGALGYEVTQSLFIGKHTLLVEGPGDILFLQAWSGAQNRRGRARLDTRWTICPAGGLDKIQPFVALFSGARLDIAVLSDFAKADKRKLEALKQNKILESNRLLTIASVLGVDEADIEDVFSPGVYADILNQAFGLPPTHRLTAASLTAAAPETTRLVKKAEACFRTMPPEVAGFDHYTPADWLIRNPGYLDADTPELRETLERAAKVIEAVNSILRNTAAVTG